MKTLKSIFAAAALCIAATADDVTLTWASYEPWPLKGDGAANPLVIWLHGGGEGGDDVAPRGQRVV